MKVVWTETAISHLTNIHDYISRDSERWAQRMVDRITSQSKRIGDHPELGQVVAEYGLSNIREVYEGPYRVIYRVTDIAIEVVAVVHGAMLLPDSPISDIQ